MWNNFLMIATSKYWASGDAGSEGTGAGGSFWEDWAEHGGGKRMRSAIVCKAEHLASRIADSPSGVWKGGTLSSCPWKHYLITPASSVTPAGRTRGQSFFTIPSSNPIRLPLTCGRSSPFQAFHYSDRVWGSSHPFLCIYFSHHTPYHIMSLFKVPGWDVPSAPLANPKKRKRPSAVDPQLKEAERNIEKLMKQLGQSSTIIEEDQSKDTLKRPKLSKDAKKNRKTQREVSELTSHRRSKETDFDQPSPQQKNKKEKRSKKVSLKLRFFRPRYLTRYSTSKGAWRRKGVKNTAYTAYKGG